MHGPCACTSIDIGGSFLGEARLLNSPDCCLSSKIGEQLNQSIPLADAKTNGCSICVLRYVFVGFPFRQNLVFATEHNMKSHSIVKYVITGFEKERKSLSETRLSMFLVAKFLKQSSCSTLICEFDLMICCDTFIIICFTIL